MAISEQHRAQIMREYQMGFSINKIARLSNLHHSTVSRILHPSKKAAENSASSRQSRLDAYGEYIKRIVKEYPGIKATALMQALRKRGVDDVSISTLRRYLRGLDVGSSSRAYVPVTVSPGEQAQVDWAHFGKLPSTRRLSLFVMVLSYSRMIYARFYTDQSMSSVLSAHQRAFEYFGGVPSHILYDNMRTVVRGREGSAVRFTDELYAASGSHGFIPMACTPRSGWEKGRVERAIRYIRESFWLLSHPRSLDDANAKLEDWLMTSAQKRPWPEDRSRQVGEVFLSMEHSVLGECRVREPYFSVHSSVAKKYPYIRLDKNDYSIPMRFVGVPIEIWASEEEVKMYHQGTHIATHLRSYQIGEKVEDKVHIDELIQSRRHSKNATRRQRLWHLFPRLDTFLSRLNSSDKNYLRALEKLLLDYRSDLIRHVMDDELEKSGELDFEVFTHALAHARLNENHHDLRRWATRTIEQHPLTSFERNSHE